MRFAFQLTGEFVFHWPVYSPASAKAPPASEHTDAQMDRLPATWQLMVTFTPRTVLMVPPTSTVTAGFSVLSTVIRDVFTSGFPGDKEERELSLTVLWAGVLKHREASREHMFMFF